MINQIGRTVMLPTVRHGSNLSSSEMPNDLAQQQLDGPVNCLHA